MSVVRLVRSGPSVVLRRGRAGILVHPRAWLVGCGLALAVAVLAVVALAVGTQWLPLDDVVRGLVGEGERATNLTVRRFRLPRVVVGVLVGAALGLSGAMVQAVTRNPIAAPDVIGVTAGASFGAVLVMLAFGGSTFGAGGASAELSRIGLPLGAIAGALVAAAVVLGVGAGRGPSFGTQRVVLVGIVCHAAFMGLVHWGLTRGDVDQATRAAAWLIGGLHGRGWEHVTGLAVALAVLLPAAVLLGRPLAALSLGEPAAASLGIRVRTAQMAVFLVAFALAGAAVAAVGPVSFVALLAPPIAHRLVRGAGLPMVASALTGAALILAADVLARLAVPGTELPAGAVTALVGAPYLLWLVARTGGPR